MSLDDVEWLSKPVMQLSLDVHLLYFSSCFLREVTVHIAHIKALSLIIIFISKYCTSKNAHFLNSCCDYNDNLECLHLEAQFVTF